MPEPGDRTSQDSTRHMRAEALHFARWSRAQLVLVLNTLLHYFSRLFHPDTPAKSRLRLVGLGGMTVIALLALWVYIYTILLIPFTPGIGTLKKSRIEQPSVVLSADGTLLTHFRRVNREWVSLEQISEHVVEALIATEDHRFYDHPGFDPVRFFGALFRTLSGDRQGGSTITQQLARNMFPDHIGRQQTISRKLKELVTALKIEYAFEKDEILEAYLNTVPFYFGAYGIEMAARTYFGESAADLDILESATLVGMLKGTYYYNPVRNPERALDRRNVALGQMVKRDFLDEERFEEMKEQPIRLNFERQQEPGSRAPHFTEHVRMWLIDWADRHGYNIYRDSLVVHTTLDIGMQELAEAAVERQGESLQDVADVEWSMESPRILARHPSTYRNYRREGFSHLWSSRPALIRSFARATREYAWGIEQGIEPEAMLDSLLADAAFVDSLREVKTRLEAGFVAVDPETGWVRAWVGSRDFEKDQYDHVARARRQPGSTFKPFVYAQALEEGYAPDDEIEDREVEIPLENGYVWKPQNAGDVVSGEEFTLAEGLVYSMNTITAQLVNDVGAEDVARLARKMGVNRSELRPVPSLALGTSEVTLLEMVSAYCSFANEGVYREPIVVTRIEDRRGRVLEEFVPRTRRSLSEKTSRAVVDMMRGVVDRGTGSRIRSTFGIRQDVAGKTGTTQDGADGWFILMHPELVAGSWIGFNDPRITFRTDYWGQGGNNALFVVGDFFREGLAGGHIENAHATFPPPPEYEDDPSMLARLGGWIKNVIVSAWDALFGGEEEEGPRQGDTYISDRNSGDIRIDLDGESDSVADSLTRLEREQNRLDSLLQQLPSRNVPAAVDTSSDASADAGGQQNEEDLDSEAESDVSEIENSEGGDAERGDGAEGEGDGAAIEVFEGGDISSPADLIPSD